jgi:phosphoserine phosphatase
MHGDHASGIPLCVDLDGTLIAGDITWEATKAALRKSPLSGFALAFWMAHGRPYYKQKLAERVSIDPARLSYRKEVVAFLEGEHAKGRRILLATAAGEAMVRPIVSHLKFLDAQLVATTSGKNLAGIHKAEELVRLFGEKGFDYAGNEHRDLKVWEHARKAVVVHAPAWVLQKAKEVCEVERVFG